MFPDGSKVAYVPIIYVRTQPGLMTTHVMPRGARSIARLRMTMFTAAFELRYEPPEVLSALIKRRITLETQGLGTVE